MHDKPYREGDEAEEASSAVPTPEVPEVDDQVDVVVLVVKMKDHSVDVVTDFPGTEGKRKPSMTEVRSMLRSAYDDLQVTLSGRSAALQFMKSTQAAMQAQADSKSKLVSPNYFSGRKR